MAEDEDTTILMSTEGTKRGGSFCREDVEAAILALNPRKHIKHIRDKPNNNYCCDCGAKDPEWASRCFGVFVCIRCCGAHRSLPGVMAKIRSIELDSWSAEHLEIFERIGNDKFNDVYEAFAPIGAKPTPESTLNEVMAWVRAKYYDTQYKRFVPKFERETFYLPLVDKVADLSSSTRSHIFVIGNAASRAGTSAAFITGAVQASPFLIVDNHNTNGNNAAIDNSEFYSNSPRSPLSHSPGSSSESLTEPTVKLAKSPRFADDVGGSAGSGDEGSNRGSRRRPLLRTAGFVVKLDSKGLSPTQAPMGAEKEAQTARHHWSTPTRKPAHSSPSDPTSPRSQSVSRSRNPWRMSVAMLRGAVSTDEEWEQAHEVLPSDARDTQQLERKRMLEEGKKLKKKNKQEEKRRKREQQRAEREGDEQEKPKERKPTTTSGKTSTEEVESPRDKHKRKDQGKEKKKDKNKEDSTESKGSLRRRTGSLRSYTHASERAMKLQRRATSPDNNKDQEIAKEEEKAKKKRKTGSFGIFRGSARTASRPIQTKTIPEEESVAPIDDNAESANQSSHAEHNHQQQQQQQQQEEEKQHAEELRMKREQDIARVRNRMSMSLRVQDLHMYHNNTAH